MIELNNVTLVCVDCVNVHRANHAIKISKSKIKFKEIKLLTSLLYNKNDFAGDKIVKIYDINTIQDYSRFMIKDLTSYVDTDFALCIQWDGYILNPDAWTDEFLNYDYIGAPWWYDDNMNVGNGGFSLRSKKFLDVSSRLPIKNFNPEDLILCRTYRNLMEKEGITYAPESLAKRFSLEGNMKQGRIWTDQFGFHDFKQTDISNWKGFTSFNK